MRLEGEFDHDRLDAYRLGRAAVRELELVLGQIARGFAELVTQLRKASLSVNLNSGEGSGEFAPMEKARLYRIARRSTDECAAVLDYLVDTGVLTQEVIRPPRLLYWRVAGALVKLIQSVESRTRPLTSTPARKTTRAPSPQPAPTSARPEPPGTGSPR